MRFLLLVAALAAAAPRSAAAVTWTEFALSYTPPEGFAPDASSPRDRIIWERRDGERSCQVTIVKHRAASADAIAEHTQYWSASIAPAYHAQPAAEPVRNSVPSGAEVVASIGIGSGPNGPLVVTLLTARGAGNMVPIIIVAPTPQALSANQPVIDRFMHTIVVHDPARPPDGLPAPLPVTVADLAGDWQRGPVLRHIDASQITLKGEIMTVTQHGRPPMVRRLALFVDGAGGTVMGLVDPEKPVDLTTTEAWVRKK